METNAETTPVVVERVGEPTPLAMATSSQAISLMPVEQMMGVLGEYSDRRQAFREWLRSKLVEGVHYGIPPGCEVPQRINEAGEVEYLGQGQKPFWYSERQWKPKPSLYKAGAQFVVDVLGLRCEFAVDEVAWRMMGSKAGTSVVRCRLICGTLPFFPGKQAGDLLGEGCGAASAGMKRRDENGALKIAQKSALCDAVLNTLGLSDLFTQDLEDEPQAKPMPSPTADPQAPQASPRAERPKAVTGEMLTDLLKRWKTANPEGTQTQFDEWANSNFSVNSARTVSSWTPKQFEDAMALLKKGGAQ